MTIEQKVFSRMRFNAKALEEYGGVRKEGCCFLTCDLLDGDFVAEIRVYENGDVRGRVLDNATGEEYVQLRMPGLSGAFVGSVRSAYEDLLRDIADKCCAEVAFGSDQANRIAATILEKYSVEPDFPWDSGRYSSAAAFRHPGTGSGRDGKWFALVMNIERKLLTKSADMPAGAKAPESNSAGNAAGGIVVDGVADRDRGRIDSRDNCADGSDIGNESSNNKRTGSVDPEREDAGNRELVDVLNLKVEENKTPALHKVAGIYPAYHMNHSKWISVILDDTLADRDVMELVEESFRLTSGGARVINEQLVREVLGIADSIPTGSVMSYGRIAEVIGRPKNARLVGRIMSMADRYGEHPCHRVVNHAGRTVPGWDDQRAMLEAEGVTFLSNGNVDMKKHGI